MILALAGCKCPFCCCHKDQTPTKTTDQPATTPQTATAPLAIENKDHFDKEVLQSSLPVVIKFSATWCGYCQASKEAFESTAKQLGQRYKFVIVDVDTAEQVAKEMGIQGLPTFVFLKNGKEVHRIANAITKKDEFIVAIEKAFEKQG